MYDHVLEQHCCKFCQSKQTNTTIFYIMLITFSGALDHTTSWIKSVVQELLSATIPTELTSSEGKGQRAVPGPFQVLNAAFIRILTWDYDKSPLPEVSLF